MGQNCNVHPNDQTVKAIVTNSAQKKHQHKVDTFADRGQGTILDGYNDKEDILKFCEYYWMKNPTLGLRGGTAQSICK